MLEKVQIVIFRYINSKLHVLLLQTNNNRGAFWQNITGGVESFDKTLKDAAIREVFEEVGLEVDFSQILETNYCFKYNDKTKGGCIQESCYYLVAPKEFEVTISPNEHQSFKWADAKTIKISSYKFKTNYEAFLNSCKELKRGGD